VNPRLIARRALFCLWCPIFTLGCLIVLPVSVASIMFAGVLREAVVDVPYFWQRHWPKA